MEAWRNGIQRNKKAAVAPNSSWGTSVAGPEGLNAAGVLASINMQRQ